MNSVWILLAAGVLVALAAFSWLFVRPGRPDFGFVSQQWINEHRQAHPADRQ